MAETAKTATLTFDGKVYEFPVHAGTMGPDVIDITKLFNQTKAFTFDPGLHQLQLANPP